MPTQLDSIHDVADAFIAKYPDLLDRLHDEIDNKDQRSWLSDSFEEWLNK